MYTRLDPGHKCERCGGDNSFRAHNTRYCFECAKIVRKEQAIAKRQYYDRLVARDKMPNIMNMAICCMYAKTQGFKFCNMCGQRLKEDVKHG